MAEVTLKDLTKSFGDVKVVDRINLRVPDGKLVSLLGPSGCGKTTTLRLIAGFLKPDSGEIRVGERILSSPQAVVPPERRHMSMIFQSYALWPHMTVFDNVAYGLRFRRLSKEELARRVRAILQVVRLEQLADRYPSELSGGQQQRVALARALVIEPETLLLDEPLSNLDAHLREEMRFEIRRLHDEFRITTVYVTHDQAEAMATSDEIAIMNAGRIEQVGSPEEVYERPRTRFVATFMGTSNILDCRIEGSRAIVNGLTLILDDAEADRVNGSATSIVIRPHSITLLPENRQPTTAVNVLPGYVRRQVYLGNARDYLVTLDKHVTLRVITNPAVQFGVGERVLVQIPPEQCRVLVDG